MPKYKALPIFHHDITIVTHLEASVPKVLLTVHVTVQADSAPDRAPCHCNS